MIAALTRARWLSAGAVPLLQQTWIFNSSSLILNYVNSRPTPFSFFHPWARRTNAQCDSLAIAIEGLRDAQIGRKRASNNENLNKQTQFPTNCPSHSTHTSQNKRDSNDTTYRACDTVFLECSHTQVHTITNTDLTLHLTFFYSFPKQL